MSRCGRTGSIDALVQGELSAPEALELRGHAERCQVCRHELRWAETEKGLFTQRAARDEVRALWEQSRGPARASRRALPVAAVALAAVALLAVWARPVTGVGLAAEERAVSGELLMTLDEARLMTPASPDDFVSAELEASLGACLMMTPGHGGTWCPPALPASFATGD